MDTPTTPSTPAPQAPPSTPEPKAAPEAPATPDPKALEFQLKTRFEAEKRQMEARYKKEIEQERGKFSEVEKVKRELESLLEQGKRDPASLGKKLWGGDKWYENLTEYQLNGGKITPEMLQSALDEKTETIKREFQTEREKEKQAEMERLRGEQESQKQQARQDWVEEVQSELKENATKFRLVAKHNALPAVVSYIENHYTQTGTLLSNEAGLKAVEDQLRKAVFDSIDDDLYTEWQKSRQAAKPAPVRETRTREPEVRTLHNGLTRSSTEPAKRLTRDERIQRALTRLEELTGPR
jgi:hypothetical protein